MFYFRMAMIPLSKGFEAIIDDEDFERVSKYCWAVAIRKTKFKDRFYARRTLYSKDSQTTQYLHRFIMNVNDSRIIDHINRNTLDCRKSNLRICTYSQNQMNQEVRLDSKTGYRGVTWNKKRNTYQVRLKANNIRRVSIHV